MFEPGDVVEFHSSTAGKKKFHLCICLSDGGDRNLFLFINSKTGFAGDLVLDDGTIPGLPPSPTGKSIISLSMVVKMTEEKLQLFKATRVSRVNASLMTDLYEFAKKTRALSDIDKRLVLEALEAWKRQ